MSNQDLEMKFELLSRLSKIWHDIFNCNSKPSPFLSFEWFISLSENLLNDDPEVIIFLKDGNVVGILPAIINNDTLKLIGDERVTDLNDIIYMPGYEEFIVGSFASFIKEENLFIDIAPLEKDSILVKLLPLFLEELTVEKADLCPILPLASSWDEYLATIEGKVRHELRRKLRKVKEAKIERLPPDQIDVLFQLMSASDKNKKNFLTNEIREFFKALASAFFKKGWLRYEATFLRGYPIGVVFGFQMKNHIYLYNTGYDPDFSDLSPGIATIVLDIRLAIDEGFGYYDFLRGGEGFKFSFGASERYTMRIRR